MPRYFFNVRNGHPILKDNIGIELPDIEAAIAEGHREADLVVGALLGLPETLAGLQVQISDENGNVLERIDLPDTKEFAR
jgi:hypothetical protein